MTDDVRHLLLGAALVAAGVVLFLLSWHQMTHDSETIAKALLIIAVPAILRGIWEWSRVDGLLALALVLALALGAMGRQALVNATRDPAESLAVETRIRERNESLRMRGYIFIAIAVAAGALAAFRIHRVLRRDPS